MTDTNPTTPNPATGSPATGGPATGSPATGSPATDGADAASRVNARKVREGIVTSAAMEKTIVVTITERVRHAKYQKTVLRSKKLHTHDETNDARLGDRVRVAETRPMSKTKRWRLVEVLERAR